MATTDTELKRLNKTVEDAVNILKLYVGTSGQLKAMNEKQRETIEKWSEITEEVEDQQKRQRAFTERQRDENGRFIKKQDNQASKFMGMAKSVNGIFTGMAKGVGSSISGMINGVTSHLSSFFQSVKSHFLGLFGEESEWFELLGSIKDSIKGFAGSIFNFFFRKTPNWAKDIVGTLKDMYKLQIKQLKLDFMDAKGEKKKGIWGSILHFFGIAIIALGAVVGAFLHRYVILLTKLPIFGKIAKMFTKLESLPLIGKLLKGIKIGFKFLGWPLTILMSLIDFIRGYSSTEGSTWEKIKGGLWKALEGFIELPVRFIGWVIEKVAGWFGIEIEGTSDKMMGWIKKGFNFILSGYELLFGLLKEGVTNAINKMKEWKDPLMNAIMPIIAGVHNFFVDFWNGAIKWISSNIPSWMPGKDTIAQGLKGMTLSRMEVAESSPVESVAQTEKRKIEEKKKADQNMTEAVNMLGEYVKDNNKKTGQAINTMTNMQGNNLQNNTDTQQIPDEQDNMMLGLGNYSGEFGL